MINQENLFFIIGQGRSGTSILQQIIQTFHGFTDQNFESKDKETNFNFWDPVVLENDFSPLENFIEKNWTEKYFVEKTPISIYCLSQIYERFPNSNYIFLERDPLDIVLSQITLPAKNEDMRRKRHIDTGLMEVQDLPLNKQQYWAKVTLKAIQNQVLHKPKFKNQLTIRYEEFTALLEPTLKKIETTFGIEANLKKAQEVIQKPSRAPKSTHEIKEITDPVALELIEKQRNLWGYD